MRTITVRTITVPDDPARRERIIAANRSWRGYLDAAQGELLLGGVRNHVSSRFASRADAEAWVRASLEANASAGRIPITWGVESVQRKPEIGNA